MFSQTDAKEQARGMLPGMKNACACWGFRGMIKLERHCRAKPSTDYSW